MKQQCVCFWSLKWLFGVWKLVASHRFISLAFERMSPVWKNCWIPFKQIAFRPWSICQRRTISKNDHRQNRRETVFRFRWTPLHLASMSKNGCECIKLLVYYDRVDVDIQDRLQRTPVMYAIINGLDSHIIGMCNETDHWSIVHRFRITAEQMQTIRRCWSLEEQYPSLCLSNGISASLSILHWIPSVSLGEWTRRRKSSASKFLVVFCWRYESGESDVRRQSSKSDSNLFFVVL